MTTDPRYKSDFAAANAQATPHPLQRAMLAASVNYSMANYDPHFFTHEEVVG